MSIDIHKRLAEFTGRRSTAPISFGLFRELGFTEGIAGCFATLLYFPKDIRALIQLMAMLCCCWGAAHVSFRPGFQQSGVGRIEQPDPHRIYDREFGGVASIIQDPQTVDALPDNAVMRLGLHSPGNAWNSVLALEFSYDGNHLAARTRDQIVQIYELKSARLVSQIKAHSGYVGVFRFLPDNEHILTAASQRSEAIKLWDYDQGVLVREIPGGGEFIELLDRERIVVYSEGQRRIVRLDTGENEGIELLRFSGRQVLGMTESGRRFATIQPIARQQKNFFPIRIVDEANRETNQLIAVNSRPKQVVFAHNERLAAAAFLREKEAYVWDLEDPTRKHRLEGHIDRVEAITFSPDDRLLATASWDRTVKIWDCLTGTLLATLNGHDGPVCAVTFSKDGRWLASGATGNQDCTILIWDLDQIGSSHEFANKQQLFSEPEALWESLGNAQPHQSLHAVAIVADQLDQHRSFIEQQIASSLELVDNGVIQEWIEQLGSPVLEERELAQQQLLSLRAVAEPQLQLSHGAADSAEVRFRINTILSQPVERPAIDERDWRRLQRLIHALERAGDDQAKQLIELVANGHQHIDISRAARDALRRLNLQHTIPAPENQ